MIKRKDAEGAEKKSVQSAKSVDFHSSWCALAHEVSLENGTQMNADERR
jgi:hypothetical protein